MALLVLNAIPKKSSVSLSYNDTRGIYPAHIVIIFVSQMVLSLDITTALLKYVLLCSLFNY